MNLSFEPPRKFHLNKNEPYIIELSSPIENDTPEMQVVFGLEQHEFNNDIHLLRCKLDLTNQYHVEFKKYIDDISSIVIGHITMLSPYYEKDDFKGPIYQRFDSLTGKPIENYAPLCIFKIFGDYFDDMDKCTVIYSGKKYSVKDAMPFFTKFQQLKITYRIDNVKVFRNQKQFGYNLQPTKIVIADKESFSPTAFAFEFDDDESSSCEY